MSHSVVCFAVVTALESNITHLDQYQECDNFNQNTPATQRVLPVEFEGEKEKRMTTDSEFNIVKAAFLDYKTVIQ